jgi:hypothetical protein
MGVHLPNLFAEIETYSAWLAKEGKPQEVVIWSAVATAWLILQNVPEVIKEGNCNIFP